MAVAVKGQEEIIEETIEEPSISEQEPQILNIPKSTRKPYSELTEEEKAERRKQRDAEKEAREQ